MPALAAAIRAAYRAPVVQLLREGALDESLAEVPDVDAAALMIFASGSDSDGAVAPDRSGEHRVDDATSALVSILLDGLGGR